MSTTGIVYQTLSKYNELTAGAIHKKCAGMPGIANLKSVSNALTRLKKEGRVESIYDEDKGLWLWHIVRESPVASSEAAMRIGDAAAMDNRLGTDDHSEHDLEMASDVAELEQPVIKESLTTEATHGESSVVAKPRKPYTPNKIAGAYAYRGALVIKLDRKAHAKSITLSAKDMAMLASIYGNMS